MRTSVRALLTVSLALPLVVLATSPTLAAGKGKSRSVDTTVPVVSISNPVAGSSTGSDVTVAGSASDNKSVAAVYLQIDGGAWTPANGTTSWSFAFSGFSAGSHIVTARASDGAGNTGFTSVSFSVTTTTSAAPAPTASPSPTSSPSPSPSPTATTTSPSPSPTTTTTTTSAPSSQGSWTSPEGVRIVVNTAGPWTIAQVYRMLKENALHLSLIGPSLTVNVQDTYASQATTGASQSGSTFTNFQATIYLKGVNSTFTTKPDAQLSHEYGHVWTRYWAYMNHGGSWSSYLTTRWSSSNGSITLASDSRTGTSYTWDPSEIVADDYRLLFGSATAISQSPNSLNTSIVAPSGQPGLRDWFLSTWA